MEWIYGVRGNFSSALLFSSASAGCLCSWVSSWVREICGVGGIYGVVRCRCLECFALLFCLRRVACVREFVRFVEFVEFMEWWDADDSRGLYSSLWPLVLWTLAFLRRDLCSRVRSQVSSWVRGNCERWHEQNCALLLPRVLWTLEFLCRSLCSWDVDEFVRFLELVRSKMTR